MPNCCVHKIDPVEYLPHKHCDTQAIVRSEVRSRASDSGAETGPTGGNRKFEKKTQEQRTCWLARRFPTSVATTLLSASQEIMVFHWGNDVR